MEKSWMKYSMQNMEGLRERKIELFPSESAIKDSAIYKASPLHKVDWGSGKCKKN